MSAAPAPLRGLPGPLPEGESVLWQGSPDWRALARDAFHLRALALYFAAAMLVVGATSAGSGLGATAISLGFVAAAGLAVLAFVALLARIAAATTVYTVTSRRVVMRVGMALPLTVNIPFGIVAGASVKVRRDGSGDLPVALTGRGRIGYIHLWPHARAWRLARPEPMMRSVPEVRQVAAILARALGHGGFAAAAAGSEAAPSREAAIATSVAA